MELFKYLNPSRIDVLENLMIRFSMPNDFNDPFESYPSLGGIKELAGEETFYNENLKTKFEAIQNESVLKYLPANVKIPEEFMYTYSKMTLGEAAQKICGNDNIFEKVLRDYPDKVENQIARVINNDFNRRFGVLCLSEKHDNLIMWSHYAQNHEGYVIGFDSTSTFFDQRKSDSDLIRILTKVDYMEERPELFLYNTEKSDDDLITYLLKYAFLTKSIHWSAEQEWRMVMDITKADVIKENVHLFKFPLSMISSIFLGVKMTSEAKRKIVQICKEQKIAVPIYEGFRDPKKYAIQFRQIDSIIHRRMKHSRRGRIIELMTFGKTDNDILEVLNKEFPKGTFLTSNKQALAGTKWDLGIKSKNKKGLHSINKKRWQIQIIKHNGLANLV